MRQNEKWMHVSHFRLRRKFEKKRDNEIKVLIEIGCRITCPTGNMIPGTGCLFHANRYFFTKITLLSTLCSTNLTVASLSSSDSFSLLQLMQTSKFLYLVWAIYLLCFLGVFLGKCSASGSFKPRRTPLCKLDKLCNKRNLNARKWMARNGGILKLRKNFDF